LAELHPDAGAVFIDTYLLEFLDLPLGHFEADLQRGLVEKLKQFLIKLGRDFCFVGSYCTIQMGGRLLQALGELLADLFNCLHEFGMPGPNSLLWDARHVASGRFARCRSRLTESA
jgi:hypothetical protein